MVRVLFLGLDGTPAREDAATGPDGLDHVQSAKLARAIDDGRVMTTTEPDGCTTYVVVP